MDPASINIIDYGATPDDATDDTAAIQRALNAAAATGRRVFAPAGTFILSSTISITTGAAHKAGPSLVGEGRRATTFDSRVANGPAFSFTNTAHYFLYGGGLEELTITTTVPATNSSGVLLTGSWQFHIRDVEINSLTGDAVRLVSALGDPDATVGLHIADSFFNGNHGYGLDIETPGRAPAYGSTLLWLSNTYFLNNSAGGARVAGSMISARNSVFSQNDGIGLQVKHVEGLTPVSLDFADCSFENNATRHLEIEAGINIRLVQNQFISSDARWVPFGSLIRLGAGVPGAALRHVDFDQNYINVTIGTTPLIGIEVGAETRYARVTGTFWQSFDVAGRTRIADSVTLTYVDEGASPKSTWTRAGDSTRNAKVGGVIFADASTVGNAGGGEADLRSTTLEPSILGANNETIEVEAAGRFAANANPKRLRVRLIEGGNDNVVFDSGLLTVTAGGNWVLRGTIIRTGGASGKAMFHLSSTGSSNPVAAEYGTVTATWSHTTTLKLTGEGTSDNDAIAELWEGKWAPAP